MTALALSFEIMTRLAVGVAAFAALAAGAAFVVAPARAPSPPSAPLAAGARGAQTGGWGLAAAGLALGAHVGLAAAWRLKATATRAEGAAGASQRSLERLC